MKLKSSKLQTERIPGELPELWNRQVIFFANILSLFFGNETGTKVLKSEVGSLETYGSRLIPIVNLLFKRENNLLILEKRPDDVLINYFKRDIYLTIPDIEVLDHDEYLNLPNATSSKMVKLLRDHPAQWIDGYVTDASLAEIASFLNKKSISTFEGSRDGNNKLLLHNFLKHNHMPTFDTVEAVDVGEVRIALKKLCDKGYQKAVIKSSIGASGIGLLKVSLEDIPSIDIPEYLLFDGPCLVQGWLDNTVKGINYMGSPSVQMFLSDDLVSLHDITDQILSSASVHEGNIAPPSYIADGSAIEDELLSQAEVAGKWLHNQGYRGTASVDFHVVTRNDKLEVRVCEINARVTGATYPALLARHLIPKGAWLMRNIRFSPAQQSQKILESLDKVGLLYRPSMRKGVMPFNFNTNDANEVIKGQFLFIGRSKNDTLRVLKLMSDIESLKGVYDRD